MHCRLVLSFVHKLKLEDIKYIRVRERNGKIVIVLHSICTVKRCMLHPREDALTAPKKRAGKLERGVRIGLYIDYHKRYSEGT